MLSVWDLILRAHLRVHGYAPGKLHGDHCFVHGCCIVGSFAESSV